MLRLINHQQNLELLGKGRWGGWLLHKPGSRSSRLFDRVGDGAEGAEETRWTTRGLGLLRLLGQLGWTPLLGCRGACWRLGWCRSFGWGLGRYRSCGRGCTLLGGRGCRGGWWSRWVRPLEICHVAIGQVGHEAAVGKTTPKEVHGCSWMVGLSGFFFFFFLLRSFECPDWMESSNWGRLDRRLDEWQGTQSSPNGGEMCDGELLLCWLNEEQGGMDVAMKQLWSRLQETAPQSAATPAEQRVCVVFHLLSLTLPNVWRVRLWICLQERGVVSPPVGEVSVPPPLLHSAFLPLKLLQAECAQEMLPSVYFTPSSAHAFLLLFSSLTHSLLPPPPLLLLSLVILLLHHKRCSSVVLQHCSAVCRVQPERVFPGGRH